MTEESKISAALAKAQSNFRSVFKNKVNPAFKQRYADLQSILDAVRPALNEQGIFITQTVTCITRDGVAGVEVETIAIHESGEKLSSGVLFMPVGPKANAQGYGSAETYGRRYSLSAFLGVASEDDDDGAAASQQQARAAPKEEAPVLTEAKIEEAKRAADKGLKAYKQWFVSQTNDVRTELIKSGWHDSIKARATSVDAAKEQ